MPGKWRLLRETQHPIVSIEARMGGGGGVAIILDVSVARPRQSQLLILVRGAIRLGLSAKTEVILSLLRSLSAGAWDWRGGR